MKELSEGEIRGFLEEKLTGLIYLYTPMCGTCQVAGRMVEILEQLQPTIRLAKANLNYMPKLAEALEVQSVPCLLVIKEGKLIETIFAFHSVPYLHDKVNTILS
ncbi:thioredoxin family protein [Mesobacillus harenae]|uniref:thioredoxin family protein n=1 Tax=Mesobacillus harenae TaxID=2213203 RepID=UPI001580C84C|nr:thioredoxin family protein [Mesobacillus harenae]